jgi:hypothetical protein
VKQLGIQTQGREHDEHGVQQHRRREQRVDWPKENRADRHSQRRNTRFDESAQILKGCRRVRLFADQVVNCEPLTEEGR